MPHRIAFTGSVRGVGQCLPLSGGEPAYLRIVSNPVMGWLSTRFRWRDDTPLACVPGEFGGRLEDHFYMTDEGPRWFTQPSYSVDDPFGLNA